jgi:F5/8 type C domain/Secretion system C-terminal sorting domain
MKHLGTGKRASRGYLGLVATALLLLLQVGARAQSPSRIHYASKEVFLSGINVAWVNFAGDFGPNAINAAQFQKEFQTVHAAGGNALRVWLHINGSQTPVYDANGYVTGPGPNTIQNLRQLLGLARQNNVGLILCLWSFDMLRTTEIDSARLYANIKMLTDTAYTMAYVRNCLIPMVDSVKGDSAIIAWEVCNEPNGMTTGMNYYTADPTVATTAVQTFTNLIAGGIHSADPSAFVTTGPGSFQTLSDVNPVAGSKLSDLKRVNSLSQSQLQAMADEFNANHRTPMTTQQMLEYLDRIAAVQDTNIYSDSRLIAAGGDTMGTLNFYSVHYYFYGSSALSPFTHQASYWGLDKPIVVAEFWMQSTDGLNDQALYPALYNNGYAGALDWSWTDFPNTPTNKLNAATDTWSALQYMFTNYRNDVIIHPQTGTIYLFSASATTIEKSDNATIKWDVEPGSTVKLNGITESNVKDSLVVSPSVSTTYTLIASGVVTDTASVTITVLPTGRIISFSAFPVEVGTGENTTLYWHVVKNSTVTLNDSGVSAYDSLAVYPTATANTYKLLATGDETDSTSITIPVLAPDQVNRALGATVTASSNDTVAWSLSAPARMVDGNNYSRWQAAATPQAQTVILDLRREYKVSKVVIRWGNKEYAKQYWLQLSPDDNSWTVLKSVTNGTGGTSYVETILTDSTSPPVGRYVSLLLQAPGSNGPYSIAELQVYGLPSTTAVVEANLGIPTRFSLEQNFPNPFNPSTKISFALPSAEQVTLVVYNILGQKVAELVNKRMSAGNYSVNFDGARLSSGVYFYRLIAGSNVVTRKMILLK